MNSFIQFLTYCRIFISPLIFILILGFNFYGWALCLFVLASISDFWDGFLARKYKLTSEIGAVLDPIADKILVLFVIMALALSLDSLFIGLIGSFILAREFWVAALRDLNARYNNSEATKVTFLAKAKTTFQFLAISSYLFGMFLGNSFIIFLSNFLLLVALLASLITGIEYSIKTFDKNR